MYNITSVASVHYLMPKIATSVGSLNCVFLPHCMHIVHPSFANCLSDGWGPPNRSRGPRAPRLLVWSILCCKPALGEVDLFFELVDDLVLPVEQLVEGCNEKVGPLHCQRLSHLQQFTIENLEINFPIKKITR